MQIKPTPAWSQMTNTKVNYSTDTKKLIRLFRQEIYVCIIFNPLQISISWYAFGSNHSPEAVWIVSIRMTHLGSALLLHPHTMKLIPLQVSGIKYPQDGSKVIIASFRNQEP